MKLIRIVFLMCYRESRRVILPKRKNRLNALRRTIVSVLLEVLEVLLYMTTNISHPSLVYVYLIQINV